MEPLKMKPRIGIASTLMVWVLVGGAVALVTAMMLRSGADVMGYVVAIVMPLFFLFVAFSTTFAMVVSSVRLVDGTLYWASAEGLKGNRMVFSTSELDAIWEYRRSVMVGNRVRTAAGVAFRRKNGDVLHMDMSAYSVLQRQQLVDAVVKSNPLIVVLVSENDTGKVYRTASRPAWETQAAPAPAPTEAPKAPTETPTVVQEPAAPARPPVIYHYTVYEHGDGARCAMCGVRIASAITPGQHETEGYLEDNGRKWVCKECWKRFARQYNWIDR